MCQTIVPKTRGKIIFLRVAVISREKNVRNNIQIFFSLAEMIYCGKLDLSFLPLPSQYHACMRTRGGSPSGCICVSVHFPKYDLQQKKKKEKEYVSAAAFGKRG